jgi:hypothetical protein
MKKALLLTGVLFLLTFGDGLAQVGRDHIVVRVFLDSRCDGFYQSGVDRPLANVPVLFDNGAAPQLVETSSLGLSWIGRFKAVELATMTVSVMLPATYRGYGVEPCDGQPASVELNAGDFQGGSIKHKFLQFGSRLVLPEAKK